MRKRVSWGCNVVKQSAIPAVILLAFGIFVGYYAYRVFFPHGPKHYLIQGESQWLSHPDADQEHPHLYLRRTWHITQQPIAGWVELKGHDEISLFVNGQRITGRLRSGTKRITGATVDITPYLKVGKNSIGVYAKQITLGKTPRVAIRGEYTTPDGTQHVLRDAEGWRASNVYDRRGVYWWQTDFDDTGWVPPDVSAPQIISAPVSVPPRSVTTPFDADWIIPQFNSQGRVVLARAIQTTGRPRSGWLRTIATAPCRIAINGLLLDDDFNDLAELPPYNPKQITYDVSDLLVAGENVIAVSMDSNDAAPRLRGDLEIELADGERIHIKTDQQWSATAFPDVDWLAPSFAQHDGWQSCQTDSSFADVPPWRPKRELRTIRPSWDYSAHRWKRLAGCVAITIAAGWLGCLACGMIARALATGISSEVSAQIGWLALLPSALVAATAIVMEQDPSFAAWQLFDRNLWMLLGLAIIAQWTLTIFLATTIAASKQDWIRNEGLWQFVSVGLLMVFFGLGLGMRLRQLTAEPIHHDEVGAYAMTIGVLKNGVPSGQAHDDLRFGIAATSELVYYPMALAGLIFEDPLEVIRVPAVVFSMLTILLSYYVGAQCFNRVTGLLAACFMAFSPYAIGMATFGRYFSQLQLLSLLTVYLTFRAVHTTKGLRQGYLWAATISFICMYLSWEGSGIIGIPLAAAVIWHRRKHLRSLFCSPSLYACCLLVISAALIQNSHRTLQQTQRMWYGSGISGLSLKPMWRYPLFDLEYYLIEASWIRSAFMPLLLLGVALALAIHHPFKRRLQFFLIVLLGTCGLMGALLPLRSGRYAYHLCTIFALIAAAVVGGVADWMFRQANRKQVPLWCQYYVGVVTAFSVVVFGVLCTGQWIRPQWENPLLTSRAYDVDQLRYPNWLRPMQYLRRELREGDIVISHIPHVAEFAMHQVDGNGPEGFDDRWRVDYWLESKLIIQSSLGDTEHIPRDRRSGAKMISNIDQLKRIFADHERIWYLTMRHGQGKINDREVSDYIRNNMDVAYEDFVTTVMLRGQKNRPAEVQKEDDDIGKDAGELYLK